MIIKFNVKYNLKFHPIISKSCIRSCLLYNSYHSHTVKIKLNNCNKKNALRTYFF